MENIDETQIENLLKTARSGSLIEAQNAMQELLRLGKENIKLLYRFLDEEN